MGSKEPTIPIEESNCLRVDDNYTVRQRSDCAVLRIHADLKWREGRREQFENLGPFEKSRTPKSPTDFERKPFSNLASPLPFFLPRPLIHPRVDSTEDVSRTREQLARTPCSALNKDRILNRPFNKSRRVRFSTSTQFPSTKFYSRTSWGRRPRSIPAWGRRNQAHSRRQTGSRFSSFQLICRLLLIKGSTNRKDTIQIYSNWNLETPLQLLIDPLPLLHLFLIPSPLVPFPTLHVLVTVLSIANKARYNIRAKTQTPRNRLRNKQELDVTLLDLRRILVIVKLVMEEELWKANDQYLGGNERSWNGGRNRGLSSFWSEESVLLAWQSV